VRKWSAAARSAPRRPALRSSTARRRALRSAPPVPLVVRRPDVLGLPLQRVHDQHRRRVRRRPHIRHRVRPEHIPGETVLRAPPQPHHEVPAAHGRADQPFTPKDGQRTLSNALGDFVVLAQRLHRGHAAGSAPRSPTRCGQWSTSRPDRRSGTVVAVGHPGRAICRPNPPGWRGNRAAAGLCGADRVGDRRGHDRNSRGCWNWLRTETPLPRRHSPRTPKRPRFATSPGKASLQQQNARFR
jgi:hypothetical protein